MVGKPVDTSQPQAGWQTYLGANIGAKLGSALIDSALFGSSDRVMAQAAQARPTLYNTPEEFAKIDQSLQEYVVKEKIKSTIEKQPSWKQDQERKATLMALKSGEYAIKGDFSGELNRTAITDLQSALAFLIYKGQDPNEPEIVEALKKYPVTKQNPKTGKVEVVGKFAGFDNDGEILVE